MLNIYCCIFIYYSELLFRPADLSVLIKLRNVLFPAVTKSAGRISDGASGELLQQISSPAPVLACFLSSCLQFNDLVVLLLLQRWEALRWLRFSEGSRCWTSPLVANSTQILQRKKTNKSSVTEKHVQILDQVVATFLDKRWRVGERCVFWKLCSVCI